jgi:RimJ/RimL family protein N-acetyltransferase
MRCRPDRRHPVSRRFPGWRPSDRIDHTGDLGKLTGKRCEDISMSVRLKPLDRAEIDLVAKWLAEEENSRWLDFGSGQRIPSALALALMAQRGLHLMRVFTPADEDKPVGVVALSYINWEFKTAALWYVLGDKAYGGRGYTTLAVSRLLTLGFEDGRIQAVNAWAVAENTASLRVLERNHFRPIGRQRQCHTINGRAHDRLLFDLLASEHKEIEHDEPHVGWAQPRGPRA